MRTGTQQSHGAGGLNSYRGGRGFDRPRSTFISSFALSSISRASTRDCTTSEASSASTRLQISSSTRRASASAQLPGSSSSSSSSGQFRFFPLAES